MGNDISLMIKSTEKKFIEIVYDDLVHLLDNKKLLSILTHHLTKADIYHLKENIYNLDFRVTKKFFTNLHTEKINLNHNYSDLALMGIFATIRETLFGLLIYLTYLRDEEYIKEKNIHTDFFITLWLQDILHLDEYYHKKLITIINDLQADFNEIIKHRIEIDDNKEYLNLALNNRKKFTGTKSIAEIKKMIISEDIIRFK